MNSYLLNIRLGSLPPVKFQRAQYDRLARTIEPALSVRFNAAPRAAHLGLGPSLADSDKNPDERVWAHNAGVNVLAVDRHAGRYLFSGGADATVRLWDLEEPFEASATTLYRPSASLARGVPEAHTHGLTSLSIYPFDPTPTTLLTTSYDTTLKLSAITPTSIQPVHTFQLTHTPYAHSLSSLPSSTLQIAVATSNPAIQLLDLRSGLSTHTLPGHTGSCLSLSWSPSSAHIIASASSDSRALLFDIRRANAAFACLDLDDSVGAVPPGHTPSYSGRQALDWNARAHSGPVTGIQFTPDGRHIVTCGHDQRIRVWDATTGANTLVHFGPRIKNSRNGEFSPLITPKTMTRPGKPLIFWANDDSKGEILVFDLLEGNLERVLRVPGAIRKPGGMGQGKITSSGRVNCMAWRVRGDSGGCEMVSGHGDGGIRLWRNGTRQDDLDDVEGTNDPYLPGRAGGNPTVDEEEQKRKRKRDVLGDIVQGLTKQPITFS